MEYRSCSHVGSYKMRKCESAKVNMYKMRKFDAKDFAFYIRGVKTVF